MFLEEIIIDGFKSYGQRTVLSGFDPNFTAITGLNGSGKSNIIDAISFVLGITNWQQLRVNSPHNLVYKDGQAGVQRASVTLVFNNADKSQSPLGFEKVDQITVTRQVAVGGHGKYLLNGHNATAKRVKMLFRSVQLNIKNPHFLIMQGRITKVLNMKPPEILGMIEEAAGTKMYDDKRQEAIKEMERKQRKVDEFKRPQILANEITPTLTHLKRQQQQYMAWLEAKRDHERLDKFRVAYQYTAALNTALAARADLAELQRRLHDDAAQADTQRTHARRLHIAIADSRQQRSTSHEGEQAAAEKELGALARRLAAYETAQRNLEASTSSEVARLGECEAQGVRLEALIAEAEAAQVQAEQDLAHAERARDEAAREVEGLRVQVQALEGGVAAQDGATLADQLLQAQRDAAQHDAEHVNATQRAEAAQSDLRGLVRTKADRSHATLLAQADTLIRELSDLVRPAFLPHPQRSTLAQLPPAETSLVAEAAAGCRHLQKRVREKRDEVAALRSRLEVRVGFVPGTPLPQGAVLGRIVALLRCEPGREAAVEAAAQGRLHNVVVDTEQTAATLLHKGQLRQQTTFIPLNKIAATPLATDQLRAAERVVGAAHVRPALALVEYSPAVAPAMEFVFGRTLVCAQSTQAEAVAFHPEVRARTVTHDGDVFEPAGTLSGGSRDTADSLLAAVHALRTEETALAALEAEVAQAEAALAPLEHVQAEAERVRRTVELKAGELELIQQRLGRTEAGRTEARRTELEARLQAERSKASDALRLASEAKARVQQLQTAMAAFDIARQLTESRAALARTRKALPQQAAHVQAAQQLLVRQRATLAELRSEHAEAEAARQEAARELTAAQQAVQTHTVKLQAAQAAHSSSETAVAALRAQSSEAEAELAAMAAKREQLVKAVEEHELNAKKWAHKMESLREAEARAERLVQQMGAQYAWIAGEAQFFGRAHSEYDFSAHKIDEVLERLQVLAEQEGSLGQAINRKAVAMFEAAQAEYSALVAKKTQVEADRAKIEAFIASLDQMKGTEIERTHRRVDADLGAIFARLLPGATARLVAPEGQSIFEGLRVQVALGGVWKDTLSELSGGQRSLLALSLVLAMLVYKPAPMYILDEIDAALDLSHTQNIGELIRTHFKQAQFIIISLKEGMFTNASVLYRIRNVNGSSQVQRIDNRHVKRKETDEERDRRTRLVTA